MRLHPRALTLGAGIMFENLLAITSHLEHAMDNSLQSILGMLSVQFQIRVVIIIIRGPIHYMKDHLKLT